MQKPQVLAQYSNVMLYNVAHKLNLANALQTFAGILSTQPEKKIHNQLQKKMSEKQCLQPTKSIEYNPLYWPSIPPKLAGKDARELTQLGVEVNTTAMTWKRLFRVYFLRIQLLLVVYVRQHRHSLLWRNSYYRSENERFNVVGLRCCRNLKFSSSSLLFVRVHQGKSLKCVLRVQHDYFDCCRRLPNFREV